MQQMEAMTGVVGLVWIAVAVFLVILAVAWTLLPFAMFGLKPLLRDLITETRRTNVLLDAIATRSRAEALPTERPDPGNVRTR